MADSPQPSAAKDLGPVYATLRFLHRHKRVYQFTLKGAVAKRKQLQAVEASSREQIHRLNLRIQRELDAHPELAQGQHGGEEWAE